MDTYRDTEPFDLKEAEPFDLKEAVSNYNLHAYTCTGGVRPPVARGCAPVCPSQTMPLADNAT